MRYPTRRTTGRQSFAAGLASIALLVLANTAVASAPSEDEGEMSLEEISRMLDNPLGNLWILFMQNDMMRMRGDPSESSQWTNVLTLQPIMPIPLTENWNLVARPIIPFITAPEFELGADAFGDCPPNCNSEPPDFSVDSSRENAWGDIMLWTMLSPVEPVELGDGSKLVWGAGPAARFPTATKDKFGSEKYTFGPSALALRQPPKDHETDRWTLGLFTQHHLWSIGGSNSRDRVKTSQFQPIYWYQLDTEQPISIGAAPMIDVNWEADSRDKWSIPLGIGASTTMFMGPMPVRFGVEFNWFVVSPDNYGKKFLIKFYFVPVIPRLIKEPVFGD